jgi:hypothetical protein
MTKAEFLFAQLDTTLGWYKQSEEKAKFLVTINTAVVGIANGLLVINAPKGQGYSPVLEGPVGLLLVALSVSLLLSFAFILRAVWARHHTLNQSAPEIERLWFFGDIASMQRERHAQLVASLAEATLPSHLEAMLVSSSHILSTNVWRKHQALNWAIVFTIVAVGLLLFFGIAHVSRAPV